MSRIVGKPGDQRRLDRAQLICRFDLDPILNHGLAEQARREARTVEDIVSETVEQCLEAQWRARLQEELAADIDTVGQVPPERHNS
jgi:hypothetical protein